MPRFLILSIVGFLLLLSLWQAPKLMDSQVGAQLAQHGVTLTCLEWRITSMQNIKLREVCLTYQDVQVEIKDVDITLSPQTWWHAGLDLKHLVTTLNIHRIRVVLPEQIPLLASGRVPKTAGTKNALPAMPSFWLPTIRVEQFQVASTSGSMSPLKSSGALANSSTMVTLRISVTDTPDGQQIHIEHPVAPQTLSFTARLAATAVKASWQADLQWLATLPWLSEQLPQDWTLQAVSGQWQGELEGHWQNEIRLHSQQTLSRFQAELQVPQQPEPISLAAEFPLDIQWQNHRATLRIEAPRQLMITGLQTSQVESLLGAQWPITWQNWQPAMPDVSQLHITLPQELRANFHPVDNRFVSAYVHSASLKLGPQQMAFSEIHWQAAEQSFSSQIQAQLLSSFSHPQKAPLAVNVFAQGHLQASPEQGKLRIDDLSIHSEELGQRLGMPQVLNWGDTKLSATGEASWQAQEWQASGKYQLNIAALTLDKISLDNVNSEGRFSVSPKTLHTEHTLHLQDLVSAQLSTEGELQHFTLKATISETPLQGLHTTLNEAFPEAVIEGGTFSFDLQSDITHFEPLQSRVELALTQVSGTWQDYRIDGLSTRIPFTLDKAWQIQAKPKQLTIADLFTGTHIRNISSQFLLSGSAMTPDLQLDHMQGSVFQGDFKLQELHYPLANNSESLLTVNNLALNELVSLFGQQGIDISGSLSGRIPLLFSEGLVSIPHAMVKADTEGRLIIKDNQAFQSLKSSQETLGIALSLLEDLHYSKLQSTVQLQTDGWMTMSVNIEGVNRAQNQPINFNPTLSTNLYTGLKALRAGKNVAGQIEQQFEQ